MKVLATLALAAALGAGSSAGATPVVLAGPGEPGERLEFGGRILDKGKPVAGAQVLAYHTDRTGLYNDPAAHTKTPRLRGIATTDAQGRFAFSTIRPAPYPGNEIPAHIHLEISVPGRKVHYVTYWFDDDPIVTPEKATRDPEVVIVHAKRGPSGTWTFSNDVTLPDAR